MAFDATFAFPAAPARLVRKLAELVSHDYKAHVADGTLSASHFPNLEQLASGIERLVREGVLPITGGEPVDNKLVHKLRIAVEHFQRSSAGLLAIDGLLGTATINRLLTRPYCGATRVRPTDPGPPGPMTYALKRHPSVIRYKIDGIPFGFIDPLIDAFNSWCRHLNLEVRHTREIADANLVVSFDQLIGAPDNYLAVTDIGPPNGRQLRMVLDATKTWEEDSFRACAAHEFGHVLGLTHDDARHVGQLMNDSLDKRVMVPGSVDIEAARRTWGANREDQPRLIESSKDIDTEGMGGMSGLEGPLIPRCPAPDDDSTVNLDERASAPSAERTGSMSRSQLEGKVLPVWFGTNRKLGGDASLGFTAERSNQTTLGRVDVFIPDAHRFGELGTSWWGRLLRWDLRDDHLKIQRIIPQETAAFWAELQEEMREAETAGNAPHALVYLHGYNVDFGEAAVRAAQIGFDLKVPGAMAMFSWPSQGTLQGYPADEASIEASEPAITQFLIDFVSKSGAAKVHLIAHSMGNRGLLRSLQRIAASAQRESPIRFGQVFLAAPDVDRDVFLGLAHLYPHFAERTTLYASNGDRAVYVSAGLHQSPRAGYFLPYTIAPGIDTIAVPDFDLDHLGHSYFAEAEALLYDLFSLMNKDDPPARRQRVVAATHEGLAFWEIRR